MPFARRLHVRLLCLVLLFSVLHVPAAQAKQMVSLSKDQVYMRTGPGQRSEAVFLLQRGYPLEVTGRRGNWVHVRDFENDSGWVYRPLTGRSPHHIVKAQIANVRAGASTRTRIVGKLPYGEIVRTVARKPGWVKVHHASGLQGWIARRLLWGW
jgi:SH3-like domain-containing protein